MKIRGRQHLVDYTAVSETFRYILMLSLPYGSNKLYGSNYPKPIVPTPAPIPVFCQVPRPLTNGVLLIMTRATVVRPAMTVSNPVNLLPTLNPIIILNFLIHNPHVKVCYDEKPFAADEDAKG